MSTDTNDGQVKFERPKDIETATKLLTEYGADAKIVSGGQSLTLLLRQGLLNPSVYIDVSGISGIAGVDFDEETVVIGAGTTYSNLSMALAGNDALFAGITDAIHVIADTQVRNMGTIGGAVGHADPSLDILPPLRCLDASVRLESETETRSVPLDSFHNAYMETTRESGELVTAIEFMKTGNNSGSAYEKLANVTNGWATVGVGATVRLSPDHDRFEMARIAMAAVSDTTVRTPSVESALIDAEVSRETVAAAAANVRGDIDPLADHAGSVSYKEAVAENLVIRALDVAVGRAGGAL